MDVSLWRQCFVTTNLKLCASRQGARDNVFHGLWTRNDLFTVRCCLNE